MLPRKVGDVKPRRVRLVSLVSAFLLIACLLCSDVRAHAQQNEQNHYKLLGIKRDASTAEVRSAYKRLALKYHPDRRQDDPNAAQKFSRISSAHETLKDKTSRREYDQITGSSGGRGGGRQRDGFHNQGRQQQHRNGYYTYTRRNGRTYYEFHPNAQRSNQYNHTLQLDEQSLMLIVLLVGFAYLLGTMLNTETEDEESEETESAKSSKAGSGVGAGSSSSSSAEKPSLLALLSRRTTMIHRLSDWQVSPLKQATPSVGSKPYVVLIGVRVIGGSGADKLVREAVAALSGSSSANNGEFARERLAQLGLEKAALAWAELDALARKFATDPVCFRFLGPGTQTNDRAVVAGGEAAAATKRYSDWLLRLLGIGDPVSVEVLQRIRASMALTNNSISSNNSNNSKSDSPNQPESDSNSGGVDGTSDNKKVGVCVDGIWIVHLRRVKVRLFAPLAAEFPTTLERVGQFAKKGVLERWITKVFDGQLSVPDVSGVEDKSTYWPPTP